MPKKIDVLFAIDHSATCAPEYRALCATDRAVLFDLSMRAAADRDASVTLSDREPLIVGLPTWEELDAALHNLEATGWIERTGVRLCVRRRIWGNGDGQRCAPRSDGRGFVYLLRSERGECKIGQSINPPKRARAIGTKMPVPVELVGSFPCEDAISAEKALHDAFASRRLNGEWFDLPFCFSHRFSKIQKSRGSGDGVRYLVNNRWIPANDLLAAL